MKMFAIGYLLAFLALVAPAARAESTDFDKGLLILQEDFAKANFFLKDDARKQALDRLNTRAADLSKEYPARAEALVWEAVILSGDAEAKGGLGALSMAKQARALLEEALKMDPNTLNGQAYLSLGVLYHNVPGFPLGFGNDKKAREYLERALALNPTGIDTNYFYADFLFDHDEYQKALGYVEKAAQAPPRPGRPLGDAGRRGEIEELFAKVKKKL
jgi:tetratricopeptide (TPR) repeat protein